MSATRIVVFLSHNSSDKEAVETLALRLKADGISCWLDKWELSPGDQWDVAIEKALAECTVCIIFLGPSGIGPWHNEEMRAAIRNRVNNKERRLRIVPVILPGGRRIDESQLPIFLQGTVWVEFQNSLDDDEAFRRLKCGVRGIKPDYSPEDAPLSGHAPYVGLKPFRQDDARLFFGRDALLQQILDRQREHFGTLREHRFLALIGASGSGKSSLAAAGLLPAILEKGALPDSTQWLCVKCRPGSNPWESLQVALASDPQLARHFSTVKALIENEEQETLRLHLLARLALHDQPDSHRLIVFIDQFEEFFTLYDPKRDKDGSLAVNRRRFLDSLLYPATLPDSRVLVVITMRADFFGHCATYAGLRPAVSENQFLIGPLTPEELRECIERPAQLCGCEVEPALVDRLIDDMERQPGALPFLQHALFKLWEARDGRRLTAAAYRNMESLEGALDAHAEAFYLSQAEAGNDHDQPSAQQQLLRTVLLDLVQTGEGAPDTKRRKPLDHLAGGHKAGLHSFVVSLADAHLVVTDQVNGQVQVEISHEALITGWKRFHSWIEESREQMRQRDRIEAAAREWMQAEQSKRDDFLWRSAQLESAELALTGASLPLSSAAQKFLDASREQRDREEAEKEEQLRRAEQHARELEAALEESKRQLVRAQVEEGRAWIERSKLNAARGNNFAAALMAARAVGFSGWGRESIQDTDFEKDYPVLVTAETSPVDEVEAQDLVSNAASKAPTGFPLWQSPIAQQHAGPVSSVAWSPDGKTLASGARDNNVKLWDVSTGRLLSTLEGHAGPVNSVAWSPDGKTLASGARDNNVKLWDASSGSLLSTLEGHAGPVNSVAWSPDGKTLASGAEDSTVKLWDASSGSLLSTLKGHADYVTSVAWSPDGKTLASGAEDSTVKLWDASSGSLLSTLKGHADYITSVAWSPDGKTLASGAGDMTVKLWGTSSGRLLSTLEGHTGSINSVAWSPDGKTLASGAWDNSVKLWDASTGRLLSTLEGHAGSVFSVAWSPDGKILASGAEDRTVHLWDASSGRLFSTLEGHAEHVSGVAWSPDGKTLASAARDNSVKLWDASTGRLLSSLQGHAGPVNSVAWSPDGKTLASGAGDNSVKLWDASTGRPLSSFEGHAEHVSSVAWSPDGKTLASGARDKTVKLWDASTGRLLSSLEEHARPVTSVAWSPDGKILASGAEDRTVHLWDASTGSLLSTLEGHAEPVSGVAWSPDGKTLASGAEDWTVKLWDVNTGTLLSTLEGYTGPVHCVAWSPDGKTLASGARDNNVKLWDASSGKLLFTLEEHTGPVHCVAWSPDGKTLASGAWDNTVKLWETPTISQVNLAEYLCTRWVELKGSELAWTITTDSLSHSFAFPVVNVRSDSLLGLLSQRLVAAEEKEAEMRLLLRALNFPRTIAVWSAQASETPANAPSRRLFLGAICAQAADDLTKNLHWRALRLISHLAPAFTTESFADPHVSLGALRLATVLSTTNFDDPQFISARDALLSQLQTVAPATWQEAFKQALE